MRLKNENDWYLFFGLLLCAFGLGVNQLFPVLYALILWGTGVSCPAPDYQIKTAFFIFETLGLLVVVRWIGSSMWTDVSNSHTLLKMRLSAEGGEESDEARRVREAVERGKKQDGFISVDRPAIEKAKSGMMVSAQVVEMPRLNVQQSFFASILVSYDMDPEGQSKVDLTEDTWVTRRKRFTQTQLQNMKRRAELYGALKRRHKGKRAPFVVADRARVDYLARNDFPDSLPL